MNALHRRQEAANFAILDPCNFRLEGRSQRRVPSAKYDCRMFLEKRLFPQNKIRCQTSENTCAYKGSRTVLIPSGRRKYWDYKR